MNLERRPRLRLARLPTPLHEAARLRTALGGADSCPRILFKRDDLTDLALGGNKARKLEFLLADAKRQGATALVTTGGEQSNHARMTAAAASLVGMRAALVLTVAGPATPAAEGNLLLDRLLGAEVHLVHGSESKSGSGDEAEAARVAEVLASLEARGEKPYLVALGGSSAVGVLGYVDATRELVGQLAVMGATPRWLYHASGSRGTQAGLELGARLFRAQYRVRGIAVSGGEAEKRLHAAAIANEAAELLATPERIDPDDLLTEQGFIGEGYAIPTAAGVEAIQLVARTEGVLLDPVYTAKAMAGLLAHVRSGQLDPADTVVFLHTGGAPGLFAKAAEVLALAPD